MANRKPGGAIPRRVPNPETDPLKFSFRHLHSDHPRFGIQECNLEFFSRLFERLQLYSNLSVGDFKDQNNNENRHMIDFDQTTQRDGFAGAPEVDVDQMNSRPAWQFAVCAKNRGRVHGFILDDTFYVIWLDPFHRLYGPAS